MKSARIYLPLLLIILSCFSCGQSETTVKSTTETHSLPDSILQPYRMEMKINKLIETLSEKHQPKDVLFDNVSLLSMTSDTLTPNQSVLVQNGIIIQITPAGQIIAPPTVLKVDGSGKFLMPGLTDAHVHIGESNVEKLLNITSGVTTVREMAGFDWMIPYRGQIRNNNILAPNLYVAGTMLNYNSLGIYARVVQTPAEAREWVKRQKDAGYDYIKVWNRMPLNLLKIIANEAKKHSLDLIGHVPHDVQIHQALSLGMKTLEHFKGYYLDQTLVLSNENYLQTTRQYGNFWLCPTFATYLHGLKGRAANQWLEEAEAATYIPASTRKKWQSAAKDTTYGPYGNKPERIYKMKRSIFQNLVQNGKDNFIAGTDNNGSNNFMVAGYSLHEELRVMNELGLSTYQTLKSATINAAKALGREDEFGTIETGKRADLILLDQNPLDNLEHLLSRRGVMIRGIWLSPEKVEEILQRIAGIYAMTTSGKAQTGLQELLDYYLSGNQSMLLQPSAYKRFAGMLRKNEKAGEAVTLLTHALRQYPSYDMHEALGDAYLNSADTVKAIQQYRTSIELYERNRSAASKLKKLEEPLEEKQGDK